MKTRIALVVLLLGAIGYAALNFLTASNGCPSLSSLWNLIRCSRGELKMDETSLKETLGVVKERNFKVIHVYTALCDNRYQGIVPVPASLGNGDDPCGNLYWGARYGVKTFFKNNRNWHLLKVEKKPADYVLERCVFSFKSPANPKIKKSTKTYYMIADAYRGRNIKECTVDFLEAAAGSSVKTVNLGLIQGQNLAVSLPCAGRADLVVYVGHNGLMDFALPKQPQAVPGNRKDVVILCCKSKEYFKPALKAAGAFPLLWTTGFMAPEAYTLAAALAGWIKGDTAQAIREKAAAAYHQYQGCGLKGALWLLASGW